MPLMPNHKFGDGTGPKIRLTCEGCGAGPMEKHIHGRPPDMSEYMEGVEYGTDLSEATDGCGSIDPDGECEHGHPSWQIYWGII